MSDAAAALIKSFLLKTMVGSGDQQNADDSEADKSENEQDVPPLQLSAPQLQELLKHAMTTTTSTTSSNFNDKIIAAAKKRTNLDEYDKSMRLSDAVWATEPSGKSADTRTTPVHTYEATYAEHIAALTQSKKNISTSEAPFSEGRNAAASWNRDEAAKHLDAIMDEILREEERPNAEQRRFLTHFVARLK